MRKLSFVPVAAVLLALATGSSARADYSNTVASFGPLAYWRLNETTSPPAANAATNSGTFGASANGFYVGGTSHPVTGALVGNSDTAASFDGASGQVNVPYFSGLSIGSPFTAEAWFNPATAQTGGNLVCAMAMGHFASPRAGWLIYQSASGWNLRFYNQNGTATSLDITGGTAPVPGTWYHVVAVYDGTNASIYVNGVAATGTPTGFVANPDSPLTIGSRSDSSFYYNGAVDEVALYTNALSPGDILAHYQNGTNASRVTPYNVLVAANNPVVYHRLNEPAYTPPAPETLPVAVNSGSVGTAANGTYQPGMQAGVNGVPYSGFGANNKASRFNGVAGYIDMGASEDLNIVGPVTVIAWMKSNPADNRFQAIFGKGDTSWRMSLDAIGLGRFADGTSPDATGARNINDGQWHQMAGVYDGATLSLYVDGKLDGTAPASGSISGSGASAMIGTVPDYVNSRIFAGSVDEVAVFGTALSAADILQIYHSANVPATIVQQPISPGNVFEGSMVALTVEAVGTPILAYQWTKNSTPLAGQTTSSLVLNNIQSSQSGNYAVIVTNNYGAVTSSVVAITVQSGPPIILAQPQSLSRYAGVSAKFTVSAGGTAPLSYQWKLNGTTVLAGATTSSYTINNVQSIDQGNYSCTIGNSFGVTNTATATLTVVPAPVGGYATTILADAPIAYWRLGETSGTAARDYVGGHDGIYTNVVLGLPGYSAIDTNKAAGFGPADDSYVGEIQGISFATAAATATFTLEAWVKGPAAQNGDVGIIAKGAGAGGEQFNLDTGSGGNYRFLVRDAGGGVALCNSSVGPNNAWQHLVAVCDAPAGQLRLYVDGQQVAAGTAPANGILSTAHPVSIGSRQSGSAAYDFNFEGSIDEVAIYGTALSAGQVQAHYDARYGNSTPAVISTQPAGVTNYATLRAIFSVDAGGTPPLSYQWKFNGVDIPDATSSQLIVSPLVATNAGNYSVVINNAFGSTNSAVAPLTVLPAPTVVDLSSGLVMHLKFDGNLTDATGRGNNGTNVGSTTFVDGKIGAGSLHYSTTAGSSYNYVTLGVRPDLQFGSNVNFSVAYWVRQPPLFVQGDLPFLCNANGSTYSFGYVIAPSYQTGSWGWSLYNNAGGGVGVNGEPGAIATDGGWHHLVHTFDRNGLGKTYLDGNLVDSRPISGVGNINTGLPTNIGQDPSGTYGETGEADIDDMGVWHRVLTPLEVGAMFVGGNVNGVTFAAPPANLAVQWVGGQVRVTWSNGVLQSADNVTGPYNDVVGAVSPYVTNPTAAKKFYRIKL